MPKVNGGTSKLRERQLTRSRKKWCTFGIRRCPGARKSRKISSSPFKACVVRPTVARRVSVCQNVEDKQLTTLPSRSNVHLSTFLRPPQLSSEKPSPMTTKSQVETQRSRCSSSISECETRRQPISTFPRRRPKVPLKTWAVHREHGSRRRPRAVHQEHGSRRPGGGRRTPHGAVQTRTSLRGYLHVRQHVSVDGASQGMVPLVQKGGLHALLPSGGQGKQR